MEIYGPKLYIQTKLLNNVFVQQMWKQRFFFKNFARVQKYIIRRIKVVFIH